MTCCHRVGTTSMDAFEARREKVEMLIAGEGMRPRWEQLQFGAGTADMESRWELGRVVGGR